MPPDAARIPAAIWSRLRHDIGPYLAEHGTPGGVVLNFYHRVVARVVAERFLNGAGRCRLCHSRLAKYFQSERQPWWSEPDDSRRRAEAGSAQRLPNARRATELPWQLLREAEASDPNNAQPAVWDAPVAVLCDIAFVEVKCAAELIFELQEDYRDTMAAMPKDCARSTRQARLARAALICWNRFLVSNAHLISERPLELSTIAYNYADSGPVVESAEDWLKGGGQRNTPWLRLTRGRPSYAATKFCGAILPVSQSAIASIAAIGVELLAIGDTSGRLHTFEIGSGRRVADAPAHKGTVKVLAVAGNSYTVISGGLDGRVRQWDAKMLAFVRDLPAHRDRVNAILPLTDNLIASAGSDCAIQISDLRDGFELSSLSDHREEVNALVRLDDHALASCSGDRSVSDESSADNTVRIWDWKEGCCLRVLRGHTRAVIGICPKSNEELISVSHDGTLRLWNWKNGVCVHAVNCEVGQIKAFACDAKAEVAVVAGLMSTVAVVDVAKGSLLFHLPECGAQCSLPWICQDGLRAVVGYSDHIIRVWDLTTRAELGQLTGHLGTATLFQEWSDRWVTGSEDGTVRQWNPQYLGEITNLNDGVVDATIVAPEGVGTVAGLCSNGSLKLVSFPAYDSTLATIMLSPVENWESLFPARSGHVLVGGRGHFGLLDIQSGSFVWHRRISPNYIYTTASVVDDFVLLAGADEIAVWGLSDGQELWTAKANLGSPMIVRPLGRRTAIIGSGSTVKSVPPESIVREWGFQSGTSPSPFLDIHLRQMEESVLTLVDLETATYRSLSRGGDPVTALVISNEGWGASGHLSGRMVSWTTDSFEVLSRMDGHRDCVNALAALPQGRLVSASRDDSLRVWDPFSGNNVDSLLGHRDSVNDLIEVDPGHIMTISGSLQRSADASIRLWNIDSCECESQLTLPVGGCRLLRIHGSGFSGALLGNGDLYIIKCES